MPDGQVVVTAGPVFAISGTNGDMLPGAQDGLYAHDTRFLSTYRLRVQDRDTEGVGCQETDSSIAIFHATNQLAVGLPPGSLSIVRDRYLEESLHEDVVVVNHTMEAHTVRLDMVFDADFADVFEVRLGPVRKRGRLTVGLRDGVALCLAYRMGKFHPETWITFSAPPKEIRDRTVHFEFTLAPKESWRTCVDVMPVQEAEHPPSPAPCVRRVLADPLDPSPVEQRWPSSRRARPSAEDLPRLITSRADLQTVYNQAIADLFALRMEYFPGQYILAAGLPWYMAVFGRDSIIAAIQTKLLGPNLMLGTLRTLARLEATRRDPFREAEPGKIPHEVRMGELAVLERVPHSRYYGSIDATPLFLVLLWEAYQWTGDREMLDELMPAALAALRWIDRYGDPDGDGFVEHQVVERPRRSHRLRNQGWKDSADAVSFADGRLAEGSLALAEVQGYVYDAKRKMADLLRVVGDTRRAARLEREAKDLKQRFNQAYWMPEAGYYAIALDGEKRPVDSISSNPGHCLWSGIIDEDKAAAVVERLMAPDMFSGWGIRTLSTEMARYHPVSYHNGSVWPHDNSLIAAGMSRYGFKDEAYRVAMALFEAANAFPRQRLPELFSGYARRSHAVPVPYPEANAPQAWASGAVIYLLETLLDVRPAGESLLQEVPREDLGFALVGVPYRRTRRLI